MYTNISSSFVRDVNTNLVLSTIRRERVVSRSDLARLTNLSYPTVAAIVKYLMDEGFVAEARVGKFGGGRKPMLVEFVSDSRYIIGVHVGGSSVRAVLADLDGRFLGDILTKELAGPELDICRLAVELIEGLHMASGFSWDRVIGIGLSLRGSFDIPNRLYYYPGRPEPISLIGDLEQRFRVPVVAEHVANAAILAEYVHGMARGVKNAVFINVDTGVSAGFVIEGQLCRGALGNAGEFGHISIDPDGERCPECGRSGCLEGLVSVGALVTSARAAGIEFPEGGTPSRNIEILAELAENGDLRAARCFENAAMALASGITDLVNILNPELVILGGRVVWAYPKLVDRVSALVKAACWPYSKQNLTITRESVNEHQFLRGAVTLVQEQVFLPQDGPARSPVARSHTV